MENLNSKIEYSQIKVNDDEIDLKLLLRTLIRNKSLIGLISFVTLIFGVSYSYLLKEYWPLRRHPSHYCYKQQQWRSQEKEHH